MIQIEVKFNDKQKDIVMRKTLECLELYKGNENAVEMALGFAFQILYADHFRDDAQEKAKDELWAYTINQLEKQNV